MRDYQNIDKSAFRKGEYVGYASGTVWRITRWSNGWVAVERGGTTSFRRRTLEEVSNALEATAAYLLSVKT